MPAYLYADLHAANHDHDRYLTFVVHIGDAPLESVLDRRCDAYLRECETDHSWQLRPGHSFAMIRSWLREPVVAALVEKPRGEWLHSDSPAEKGVRADRPEALRMSPVWSLREVGTIARSSLYYSRRFTLSVYVLLVS